MIKKIKKRKKKAKDETMILSNLEYPNIIKYYDCIFEKNMEIIIMEYSEGGNLKEKIEEKKVFEENKIIDWFIEICEGVVSKIDPETGKEVLTKIEPIVSKKDKEITLKKIIPYYILKYKNISLLI